VRTVPEHTIDQHDSNGSIRDLGLDTFRACARIYHGVWTTHREHIVTQVDDGVCHRCVRIFRDKGCIGVVVRPDTTCRAMQRQPGFIGQRTAGIVPTDIYLIALHPLQFPGDQCIDRLMVDIERPPVVVLPRWDRTAGQRGGDPCRLLQIMCPLDIRPQGKIFLMCTDKMYHRGLSRLS